MHAALWVHVQHKSAHAYEVFAADAHSRVCSQSMERSVGYLARNWFFCMDSDTRGKRIIGLGAVGCVIEHNSRMLNYLSVLGLLHRGQQLTNNWINTWPGSNFADLDTDPTFLKHDRKYWTTVWFYIGREVSLTAAAVYTCTLQRDISAGHDAKSLLWKRKWQIGFFMYW